MKKGLKNTIKSIFVLVLVLSLSVPLFALKSHAATSSSIYTVFVNPSFGCSTRMNISWISLNDSSSITYTKSTDKDFKSATTIDAYPIKSPVQFSDYKDIYYSYGVSLKNLTPNTEYIFYITDKNGDSQLRKFKTAPDSQTTGFSFLALSDVHAQRANHNDVRLANRIAENIYSNIKYDFILSTGDMVGSGGLLNNWRAWESSFIFSNFMNAQTPGNHEYYKDYLSKDRITNRWFSSMNNNPKNGADGLLSSYFFIYNNVLFISIDSSAASGEGTELEAELRKFRYQSEWFMSVVEDNAGSYKYIIVYQHYSPFNVTGGTPSDGKYKQWRGIFDEYGVDLVLSGHEHTYLRTHPIFENEVSDDTSKGTVYITLPKVSTEGNLFLENGTGLIAKYDSTKNTGVGLYEVNDEGITFNLYDSNGNLSDTTFIPAKERNISPHKTAAYKSYYDVVEACDEAQRFVDLALSEKSIDQARELIQMAIDYLNIAKDSVNLSKDAAQRSKETEDSKIALLAYLKSNLAGQIVLNTESVIDSAKIVIEGLSPIDDPNEEKPSFFEKHSLVILTFSLIAVIGSALAVAMILDSKKKKKR